MLLVSAKWVAAQVMVGGVIAHPAATPEPRSMVSPSRGSSVRGGGGPFARNRVVMRKQVFLKSQVRENRTPGPVLSVEGICAGTVGEPAVLPRWRQASDARRVGGTT